MRNKKYFIILFLLIAVYVFVFSFLSFQRHYNFVSYEWQSSALRNQLIYNNIHGNYFKSFCEHNTEHAELIEFLFWPVYYFFQDIRTLYFLLVLFLGLSAWPLFLIGKKILNEKYSLLIVISYMSWAALHNLNFAYFNWLLIAPFFILFVFYFLIVRNKLMYLLFCVLAMLVREEIGVFLVLLSFYIRFLDKRFYIKDEPGWHLIPFFVGSLGLIFDYFFIRFTCANHEMLIRNFFAAGVGVNGVSNFLLILQVYLSRFLANISILLKLFLPVLFICFFDKTAFFIFIPMAYLICEVRRYGYPLNLKNIHHLTFFIPFIYISMIYAFKKIFKMVNKKYHYYILYTILLLSVSTIFFPNILGYYYNEHNDNTLYGLRNIYDRRLYETDSSDKVAWEMIKIIPEKSSVRATGDLFPALSSRVDLFEYPPSANMWNNRIKFTLENNLLAKTDYFMINKRGMFFGAGRNNIDDWEIDVTADIKTLLINGYAIVTENSYYILMKSLK